jgi:hypothetical protein
MSTRRRAGIGLLAGLIVAGAAAAPAAGRFAPLNGSYAGAYTSAAHGPGTPRLRVADEPRGNGTISVVRLQRWSGRLRCPDGSSSLVSVEMRAWRIGRTFSGFVRVFADRTRYSLTGAFTSRTKLRGVARYRRGGCDTGRVRFIAVRGAR